MNPSPTLRTLLSGSHDNFPAGLAPLQSGIADHNLQSAASARAVAHNWKTKSAARASATPLAA